MRIYNCLSFLLIWFALLGAIPVLSQTKLQSKTAAKPKGIQVKGECADTPLSSNIYSGKGQHYNYGKRDNNS